MTFDFFIGDVFMVQKSALSQIEYRFTGAKNNEGKWEVSVATVIANGYAGGGCVTVWEALEGETLRVSGNMKGCFIVQGITKQKIKEQPIKAIMFRAIEKDMISIEFID